MGNIDVISIYRYHHEENIDMISIIIPTASLFLSDKNNEHSQDPAAK